MVGLARVLAVCLLAAPVEGLSMQGFGDWFPWRRHHVDPSRDLQQQAIPVPPPEPEEAAQGVAVPDEAPAVTKPPMAHEQTTTAPPAAQTEPPAAQLNLASNAGATVVEVNESANESAKAAEVVVLDEAGNTMLRQWIASGPKQSQELKGLYGNDTWVKSRLDKSCGKGNTSCGVVLLDKMLCEALEVAGFQGRLGGTTQLQGVLNATMNKSSMQFGVDTGFRASLFNFTSDSSWPPSSHDDGSAFARLVTKNLASKPLQKLTEKTCGDFEDDELESCKKRAPRALFCQALTQAVAKMKDSDEVVPMLVEATKLRGEGEDITNSIMYNGLMDVTKGIMNMTQMISFDNWLRQGSDIDRTLRAKCIMGHAMRQYVELKCPDPLGDCAMQVYDSMICGSMQRLGDSVVSPEIEKGILYIIAEKGGQFAYDVAARRAFTAKFRSQPNGTYGPELDQLKDNADYKLKALKKKVLANSTFQAVVSRTCVPLNRIRPSCWDTAPTQLFCQALQSATAQLIGPLELFKLMQSKKAMVPNTDH